MKSYATLSLIPLLGILLLFGTAKAIHQLEYTIEVHSDGSAAWSIEQKGIGVQPSFDIFFENVTVLVNLAKERTQRDMSAERFVMNVNFSGSYRLVKYQFCWNGFAQIEDSRIRIGDVFEVEDFFAYLYGDGEVYVKYPPENVVESVSPAPHEQDPSVPMLKWYGIEDFRIGEPKIVFGREKAAFGFMDIIKQNALMIGSLIALVGVSSVSVYYFKLRKREMKEVVSAGAPAPPTILGIEDDEERVVKLLQAGGGSLYQSTIADNCGFSRAKASKLLAAMEKKGRVRRVEKGREKVVTLIEVTKEHEKTRNRRGT